MTPMRVLNMKRNIYTFLNLMVPHCCSMLLIWVCKFLSDSPGEFNLSIFIIIWAVGDYININNGSVLVIYNLVTFVNFNLISPLFWNMMSCIWNVKWREEMLLNAIYNISEVRIEGPAQIATSVLNKGTKGPGIRLFCLKDDHHACSQIKM